MKTKKAVKKRIRLTAQKKIKIRTGGQDHFNARESGKTKRNKRRDKTLSRVNKKAINTLLPYN